MSSGEVPSGTGASLVAFLRARLDEDEAAARESCYEGQRWLTEEEGVYRWPGDEPVHMADRKADARHIARHGPARVLREVEAKRAILAAYEAVLDECATMLRDQRPRKYGEHDGLRVAVLNLAAVFGDHPGYRQEWKP